MILKLNNLKKKNKKSNTNHFATSISTSRYSHMKTTRLEYPEVIESNTIRKAVFNSPTAFESWPKQSTIELQQQTPSVNSPTSVSNTTNSTTTNMLSEQDVNKQIRTNRKAKRRNNMRYMTQPVRLIEIEEEEVVASHD